METYWMKAEIAPTKSHRHGEQLNDLGFRLILIPFFGIAIPLFTQMVDHARFSHWQIKLSYLYTILIAFLVWQGNRYLLFTLRSYFNWFNKPVRKVIALLLAVSFYTVPLSSILLVGWYYLFAQGIVNWSVVLTSTLIIMICVFFIVHVYETVFLVKESESEMLKNAQLEKAKAEAALLALKNQIDPHFIFNCLNTISHLILHDPPRAALFNDHMADVYRYILKNKGNDLVMLKEELEFLDSYFALLKIRFENAVNLNIQIPHAAFETFLIPPISLQILVENAIKHNDFSDEKPLLISVALDQNELVIQNKVQRKISRKPSSQIGLANLNERYKLTTGKVIVIQDNESSFRVNLPVLEIV